MDKLSAGAERAVKEAERAIDKGKTKAGELQLEFQMDGYAKKLGYLVFDFYRGRDVDQAERQKYLDELSRLEDQLNQVRAEAAAKAQAAAEEKAARAAGGGEAATQTATEAAAGSSSAAVGTDPVWQRGPETASSGAGPSYPPVPPEEPVCDMPAQTSEAARQSAEEIYKEDGTWGRGDA